MRERASLDTHAQILTDITYTHTHTHNTHNTHTHTYTHTHTHTPSHTHTHTQVVSNRAFFFFRPSNTHTTPDAGGLREETGSPI